MEDSLPRRAFLARGTAMALGWSVLAHGRGATAGDATPMLVYKDPGCGCCEKWVGIMRASGFGVSVRNTADMESIKRRYHVAPELASCHTALVAGYLIEGHVPADLIRKLLREKPALAGLAVPGMVTGSPGMEGPTPQPYQVVGFDATGRTTVFARR